MYAFVLALLVCTVSILNASQSVVLTYEQQQYEKMLTKPLKSGRQQDEKLSFNEKIYDQIAYALPHMPTELRALMTSFLALELDWSAGSYMQDPSTILQDGYLCVTYISPHCIAAGTSGDDIHTWDTSKKTAQFLAALKGHTHSVAAIAYNSIAKMLASGSYDDSVRLWPACSAKQSYKLKGDGYVTSLALLDNQRLVAGGFEASLHMWDIEAKKLVFINKKIKPLDLSKLNNNAFISVEKHVLRIHGNGGASVSHVLMGDAGIARSIGDKSLGSDIFAVTYGRRVNFFDTRKMDNPIAEVRHKHTVKSLALCGKYLASCAAQEHTIKLWDVKNIITKSNSSKPNEPVHVLSVPSDNCLGLAASEEGDSLTAAFVGGPGFMQAWKLDCTK